MVAIPAVKYGFFGVTVYIECFLGMASVCDGFHMWCEGYKRLEVVLFGADDYAVVRCDWLSYRYWFKHSQ